MKCSHYLVHTFSPETVRRHSRPSRLLPLVYTPIDRQCIYWRKTFLQPLPEAMCTNISCAHEWEKFPDFPAIMQPRGRIRASSVRVVRELSVSPGFPHVGLSYVFSAAPHTFRSQSATGHDPIAPVPGPDSNPRASPRRGASSTRQKGAEHWPPPNVPEPLGHRSPRAPSGPVPQSLPDPLPMLQLPSRKALREGTGPFDGMRCFPGKPCKWSHSLRALFAPGYSAMRAAFAGKTTLAHLVFGRDTGPGACHTFHK